MLAHSAHTYNFRKASANSFVYHSPGSRSSNFQSSRLPNSLTTPSTPFYFLFTDGTTQLSAVVSCGPPSASFAKPVILQFEHCAMLQPSASWELSIWSCDNLELDETASNALHKDKPVLWTKTLTLGNETINTPLFTQVDHAEVFLVTEQLRTYVLAGRSSDNALATKRLRLAVYASQSMGGTCCIRVYAVEDTKAGHKAVVDREARIQGCLLDKPRTLPYEDNGESLCFSLEEVGNEWQNTRTPTERQELSFSEVWNSRENLKYASFELEANGSATRTYKLQICQGSGTQQDNARQVFRIIYDGARQLISSGSVTRPLREVTVVSSVQADSRALRPFRFTKSLRKQLCQCLDPPNSMGNDWRMLAQMLRVDR